MKTFIKIVLAMIILGSVIFAFGSAKHYSTQKDLTRIEETIYQLSLKCYSIEGHYPQDIQYLKTYYGLLVNEDHYRITYHIDGENLQPIIQVYAKENNYE